MLSVVATSPICENRTHSPFVRAEPPFGHTFSMIAHTMERIVSSPQ